MLHDGIVKTVAHIVKNCETDAAFQVGHKMKVTEIKKVKNVTMTKEKQACDNNLVLAMSDDFGDSRRYCTLAMPTMTMLNESRAGDAMLDDIGPNPCAVLAITMMKNDRR